ncbi:MAG: hypothetical protein RLZ98_1137 [Pseudomonadota bacterium]|jgi:maleate isomerase
MYGHRARIGYTSPPAATEVFPYEFYKIVPEGVTLVVHTLPLIDRTSDEVDRGYEASLRAAHTMARAGVSVVVLGGLPINISKGYRNADEMVADLEREIGVPVISSFSAQRDALSALGSNKALLVFPHDAHHSERHSEQARELGLTPVGHAALGRHFIDLGRISEAEVEAAIEKGLEAAPDADTVYCFCPHYATANLIDRIEKRHRLTMMTSLQAIVWKALRTSGVDDRIQGYGRLLRDF